MSKSDDFKILGFSNFLGVKYFLLQTVDGLRQSRPNEDGKELEKKISLDLYNANLMLNSVRGQIQHFLTEFILDQEFQKVGYEALMNEVAKTRQILINNDFLFKDRRLEILDSIEAIIHKEFNNIIEIKTPVKLRINAAKNVIYDLFRNLKPLCLQSDQTPLLSQTNKEIAMFIKNCIEGFETVSLDTIENQLNRDQVISKDKILVKKG